MRYRATGVQVVFPVEVEEDDVNYEYGDGKLRKR